MNWKKPVFIACGAVAGFLLAGYVVGQQPPAAQPQEGAAPELRVEPATEPAAEISPDAKPLLEQMGSAYKDLKSLKMAGSLKANFDVGGEKVDQSADFTASYVAPNQFRHEMKDSLLAGSTGEKVFVYSVKEKIYKTEDAPKGPLHLHDLMYPLPFVLARQNPSLMLALSPDPVDEALQGATKVSKAEDTEIDGTRYPTLHIVSEQGDVSLALDPKTHLLRRMTIDMKRVLGAQGQEQVKNAEVVFDYSSEEPGAEFPADHFAWTAPSDAKDAATLQGVPQSPSDALVGQPAPDFTLKDLDGKDVSLASLKGNVVVLDFWATWCVPCTISLPQLDAFAKKAGDNVKVYAVNLQEGKDVAQKFMKDKNLSLPVLLDADAAAAEKYLVQSIPATIVIDKDGKVTATFVGTGQEPRIEAAVHKALGQ